MSYTPRLKSKCTACGSPIVIDGVNAIIGSRIRKTRKTRGLTLGDVHEKTGLSVSFLSDLENGKRGVSAENILTIAKCLDVRVGWFFEPLERMSQVPDRNSKAFSEGKGEE